MKLFMSNVRGFVKRCEVDIKPVTLLVGENSSGKTTLLGCLAAAMRGEFPSADSFNKAPFEMGSYETIATYRGGRGGRAESFTVGWLDDSGKRAEGEEATFIQQRGSVRLSTFRVTSRDLTVLVERQVESWTVTATGADNLQGKWSVASTHEQFEGESRAVMMPVLFRQIATKHPRDRLAPIVEQLFQLSFSAKKKRPVVALAPLRSKPRRTYDGLYDDFKPEGDHIPRVLARIMDSKSPAHVALAQAINTFGVDSGLFREIHPKRMGRGDSDPFQIRVKSTGPEANIVDVGYGVSQALPILVDSMMAPSNALVLIQQPEVHLHPKAQAALGSTLPLLTVKTQKRLVIETHSDYLIDRVRIAVAKGHIPADHVNLIYLERASAGFAVHQMQLDASGNIEGAPQNYRAFFLQEEIDLFSRAK
jgi:predicted ATPase